MTHWKFVFYLHLIQLQTSNFQFFQLECISKINKNLSSRCCCYFVLSLIRPISRSYFLRHNLDVPLALLILKYAVSDHFQWSNVPVHQNKLKMYLQFDQTRPSHRCLNSFPSLVHQCAVFEKSSIRLSNDWNNFYETTDHLQKFRADKFSTFFKSAAFTFSSG